MSLWASENAVTRFKLHAVRHGRKRVPERPCASCSLSVAHSLICNFHLKFKKNQLLPGSATHQDSCQHLPFGTPWDRCSLIAVTVPACWPNRLPAKGSNRQQLRPLIKGLKLAFIGDFLTESLDLAQNQCTRQKSAVG